MIVTVPDINLFASHPGIFQGGFTDGFPILSADQRWFINSSIATGVQRNGIDFVANEAAKGIAQAGMDTGIPIVFGVLTTETIEQAIERAGTKAGNKGAEATLSVIEMVNLLKSID